MFCDGGEAGATQSSRSWVPGGPLPTKRARTTVSLCQVRGLLWGGESLPVMMASPGGGSPVGKS